MVPIGSVSTFRDKTGPYRVVRYNLLPAVEIDGDTAPGYSSGQSLSTMEKLADAGIRGLHGGPGKLASNRKSRLVEHALSTRMVTEEDLVLLDDPETAEG